MVLKRIGALFRSAAPEPHAPAVEAIAQPAAEKAVMPSADDSKLSDIQGRLIQLAVRYSILHSEDTAVALVNELFAQNDFLQAARWIVKVDDLSKISKDIVTYLHASFPLNFLVLGGGGDFCYPLWQNFDSRQGIYNNHPYDFDQRHILPVSARSRDLVYIHAALDACADAHAQEQLCRGAVRVVKDRGAVILTAQSADTSQLAELARGVGLMPISNDREKITSRFSYVPRISWQLADRHYLFAVPTGGSNDH